MFPTPKLKADSNINCRNVRTRTQILVVHGVVGPIEGVEEGGCQVGIEFGVVSRAIEEKVFM